MALFFWKKKKKYSNDEALNYLTVPAEETKQGKKLKFKDPAEKPEIPLSEQEKLLAIEDKYLALQPKDKKSKRKKIFQIAFLIIICVASVVLLLSLGSETQGATITLGEVFAQSNLGWFFLAVLGFLMLVIIDTAKFCLLSKLNIGKYKPAMNFKVAVIGKYYDNITPMATGGQPFQMYFLTKNNVPAGIATAIPLIKYFLSMFAMLTISLLLVIFNSSALNELDTGIATTMHIGAWVGIFLSALMPFLIISISIFPKFGKKLVSIFVGIMSKLRLIRNPQKSYYKTVKTLSEYKESLKYIIKRKIYLFSITGLCLLDYILYATIPFFLCVAFGGISPSFGSWLNIGTLYVFVSTAISFIPSPGSSGFAEGGLFLVFAGLSLTSGSAVWIVLIWRVITYYAFILLGFSIILYDFIANTIRQKFVVRKKLQSTKEIVLPGLNSGILSQRQAALMVLKKLESDDKFFIPKPRKNDIKLFLKTNYSSIPYSPSALAYKCYENGAKVLGICDSETLGGVKEFYEACKTLKVACSIGFEIKTDVIRPKLDRRINDIYQPDIINLAVVGIDYNKIDEVNDRLKKFRHEKADRIKKMADSLNKHYKRIGINLDFKEDILPISNYSEGGTVTEMHLILALCNQLIYRFGKGQTLIDALRIQMGISLSERSRKNLLTNIDDKLYIYDLQNVLKNEIRTLYVEADKECCSISELRKIAVDCGGILTYLYMGDIEQVVFGENRAEVYEDSILEYLIKELKRLGINAITVSPSRHTPEQIDNIMTLAKDYQLIVIPGETIYTRRQDVQYNEIDELKYPELIESAFAICGNQKAIDTELGGFFQNEAVQKYVDQKVRLSVFSELGKKAE